MPETPSKQVIRRSEELELTKESLITMSSEEVDTLLIGKGDESCYCIPDFAYISKKLDASSNVNLKLLWNEYCVNWLKTNFTPYKYSRFYELYAKWENKAKVTRRVIHKPG